MSILIKGMEMPKPNGENQTGLWLFIGSDGVVSKGIGGGKYEPQKAVAIEIKGDYVPKRGQWSDDSDYAQCSICGASMWDFCNPTETMSVGLPSYCPNCGAKMESEE